jgi:hypothetical protein
VNTATLNEDKPPAGRLRITEEYGNRAGPERLVIDHLLRMLSKLRVVEIGVRERGRGACTS